MLNTAQPACGEWIRGSVDYQTLHVVDSPLPLAAVDDTCLYDNQTQSLCQASLPPGDNFDILKSAALLAGIIPDQSSPEKPDGRGTNWADACYEYVACGMDNAIWTPLGYDFNSNIGVHVQDGDMFCFQKPSDCWTPVQRHDLEGIESARKKLKLTPHNYYDDIQYSPELSTDAGQVYPSCNDHGLAIGYKPSESPSSPNCFGYEVSGGQNASMECLKQREFRETDISVMSVADGTSDSDTLESNIILYNVDQDNLTVAMDKNLGYVTTATETWMNSNYERSDSLGLADADLSEIDTFSELDISNSLNDTFSDSQSSDPDSDDDSFDKEDNLKWCWESDSSDSDSDNECSVIGEESECQSIEKSSQQNIDMEVAMPLSMKLLNYYLSRKSDAVKTEQNDIYSEQSDSSVRQDVQKDFEESDLGFHFINCAKNDIEYDCPDSCICKTGKSETLPKMPRKPGFRVLEPLHKKLLQKRAMRYSNRYSYACCDRNCRLKCRRMVHMEQLNTDYHMSDLKVCHHAWGDWEEEEEEETD